MSDNYLNETIVIQKNIIICKKMKSTYTGNVADNISLNS